MTNNEAGSPLWTDDEVRGRAERWESLAIGHANMPMADYIEAAIIEARSPLLQRIAELEAARATDALRIAELEAKLIVVSKELTSTSNADRYYRGHNDGYDLGYSRGLEAQVAAQGEWTPLPDGIYDGLEVTGSEISLNSYDAYGIAWPIEHQFDDNVRLCRRTQPGGE